MSFTYTIEIDPRSRQIMERMQSFSDIALEALREEMDAQNQLSLERISIDRLSFPREGPTQPHGLRLQSGMLRRSMRATPATRDGDHISSDIGSNVHYAALHEFGFDGTVTVRPHMRRRFQRREFIGKEGRKVTRKARVGDVNVSGHDRRVSMPARRYVGGVVEERLNDYVTGFANAIQRTFGAV
jgi:phage gpG-like protein